MEVVKDIYHFLTSRCVWESCLEVVFTLSVSNAFLGFLIFAYLVDTPGTHWSIPLTYKIITQNVSSTEILVYLLALAAPTLWIMMMNWRARRHAVFYTLLLILQIVIITLSAYVYGRAKFGGLENKDFTDNFALWALAVGILSWLICLIYHRWLPTALNTPGLPSGQAILAKLEG